MQTFLSRLDDRLSSVLARNAADPVNIVIIGGGAGGVEIAFCLHERIQHLSGGRPLQITLVSSGHQLPDGVRQRTSKLVHRALERKGVQLRLGRRVVGVSAGTVRLDNNDTLPVDVTILATSAVGPSLLSQFDLPTDDKGFLLTRSTLQTIADAPIFAVGDSGTLESRPTPKAGVFAVRQGPVLWENIARSLSNRDLQEYVPQRDFLKLLNTGDRRAVAEYHGFSFHAGWCWRLKDNIDGSFMDKYQDYKPMPMREAPLASSVATKPRCTGCGGKVGADVLREALSRLDVPTHPDVLFGLDHPDDAAVLKPRPQNALTVTTDFFAAPFDDPFLVGRLAALNATSDAFALGAKPIAALAHAVLPVGPKRTQQQLLYELLAGALHELRKMSATLIGGHTIEGPQLTIGFTVLADQSQPPRRKNQLQVGDHLILTKPLGTGVLLAAHMQAACRTEWWQSLLTTMLVSNQSIAAVIDEFDIQAVTDVTGFGLAGHLMEMLRASGVSATLDLEQLPLLPGVAELIAAGVESTLAPSNRDFAEIAYADVKQSQLPQSAALFDPQTNGGMLLGVAPQQREAVLRTLGELPDVSAILIGEVIDANGRQPTLACQR